ncbi:MAG: DUF2238 domain-containing protein [Bacteroidia bacterium]
MSIYLTRYLTRVGQFLVLSLVMLNRRKSYSYIFQHMSFTTVQDSLDLPRNHYDRIVHFGFGFLLAYPMREMFLKAFSSKNGYLGYFLLK